MVDNRVRNLGLFGGGAALIVALGVAALGGPDKETAPAPVPTTTATATPSASAVAPIPPSSAVETAMADDPPASHPVSIPRAPERPSTVSASPLNPEVEFIVRFDDRHPLSRAQALYLQGKHADAEASARETLERRTEFAGLCFQRFTFGAELVFGTCAPTPRAQVRRASERWVRKLKAMPGVQYADANVIVQPERR